MNPTAASLVLALALAAAPLALADGMADVAGMGRQTQAASAGGEIGHGTGVIKAIDLAGGTITLHHGPIAAFGWPSMTMRFKASPPDLLHGLQVGQTIVFDAERRGGSARITAIRRP